MITVGDVLRILRERRNLTLEGLGKVLKMDKNTVSRAEHNRAKPDTIEKIAAVFETTPQDIEALAARLSEAWTSTVIDFSKDKEATEVWADFRRLTGEFRRLAKETVEMWLRRQREAEEELERRRHQPP